MSAGARKPHVALLGSRGIPNRYGGYETLMEELAARLVERGWRVTVYGRRHAVPHGLTEHRGAQLRVLPTLATKHLDTPVHTLLSTLDAALDRGAPFDAALVVNSANALFVPILRTAGIPTALHVDGIEKRRAKWGRFGRFVYAVSERLACVVADALVTDAEVIRRHYEERYGADSVPIAYGVEPRPLAADAPVDDGRSVLARLGVEPRRYLLYVSRFEPENNPHRVVEAYGRVGGDMPLVMVGSAPYAGRFIDEMKAAADDRVLFPGAIYGDGYRQLLSHAFAYVQATEVGGTHPALVEAMGYGNALLVNEAPENREVAGDDALYFRAAEPATFAAAVEALLAASPAEMARRRTAAAARAERLYSWPRVVDRYEALFRRLVASRRDLK
ncbi:MAG TPA: glycosyltransferase [Thermoanaerobaculia bacterium]|nr:glycosyltransferase [Thermoanaerobaculia bacterium]